MSNNDYFSEEEQFKEILNNEEVCRIKDPELRSIRLKYWTLLHKTFLNEHKIPDGMLEKEFDNIKAVEMKELDEYRQCKNKG